MSKDGLPPGIALDDPRPIAASAPYTFEMPPPQWVDGLAPGDLVKAIFRQDEGDLEYHAERMWVEIDQVVAEGLVGRLVNDPHSLTMIELDDPVTIPRSHVIAIRFAEGKQPPCPDERREYWDRCIVDACVLEGRSEVDYLYREEPDMTPERHRYPDSGWRIRGTHEGIAEDEQLEKAPEYIALGKVLNSDDRWLHLIDREIGCAFQWDADQGDYIELK